MKLVTSESVSPGHPDKVADQISDAVLDWCLSKDPKAHVACETLVTKDNVVLSGEISSREFSTYSIPVDDIVRPVVKDIGYDFAGFNWETLNITNFLHGQSGDIAKGVNAAENHQQGAGDQGIMFGYACPNDFGTEYMPVPIYYCHRLMSYMWNVRRSWPQWASVLLPDAKCQMTFDMEDKSRPVLKSVVLSHQHRSSLDYDAFCEFAIRAVSNIVPKEMLGDEFVLAGPDDAPDYSRKNAVWMYINPTGQFLIGGPEGDCGLTGRKIIVDTYGGRGRIGGGALSGKDASKVDRSAAYMCRKVAKDICRFINRPVEVAVAYAIGCPNPLEVSVNANSAMDDDFIRDALKKYDFSPRGMIDFLGLEHPDGWSYRQTAMNGHFGHAEFPWEK